MVNFRRFSVVFALASYLLATTAVHFLHDHSAGGCCCEAAEHSCDLQESPHSHADHGGPQGNCEDRCLACRIQAVKSIAPVIVTVVEQVEFSRPLELPQPVVVSVEPPALPLSRGPPRV